jgi:hypothetical protein
VYTRFWWESLKESDPLKDLDVEGIIILKINFKE